MDTDGPLDNAAISKQVLLSPADIQSITDDPTAIERYARAMGAVNLENLFKAMQVPGVNANSRIEFQKVLNRMGGLEGGSNDTAGAPQVVINISRAKDTDGAVTINGQTVPEGLTHD